jgi:hypothetical protein
MPGPFPVGPIIRWPVQMLDETMSSNYEWRGGNPEILHEDLVFCGILFQSIERYVLGSFVPSSAASSETVGTTMPIRCDPHTC